MIVNKGDSIRFTATATGGSEKYRYNVLMYDLVTQKWETIVEDIMTNTYVWTATDVGSKIFYMEVKDENGDVARSTGMDVVIVTTSHIVVEDKVDKNDEFNKDYRVDKIAEVNEEDKVDKSDNVELSPTGFIKTKAGWVYMVDEEIDTGYTGLAKNKHGWWYVKEGKLDLTYTGLAKNKHGWWYVKDGRIDFTYTGIAENQHGLWYVKDGKIDYTYSGTVLYEDCSYNVIKGSVKQ